MTQESNLLDRILFVAPCGNLAPPRAIVFGEEDLTIPSGQIQLCCVVPVLHALETIDEQQRLASAHAEQDRLRTILITGQVVHPTTLSRNQTAVKLAAKPDLSALRSLGFDERWPVTIEVFGADSPCEACFWEAQ